jgi:PAS domain-containing protein
LGDDAALDEAQTILGFVEALNAVEDLQTLLDLLAEGVARTAGWDVAVLSVYLPDGAILGGYHLPEDERVRFLSSMARTPLAMRLAKRAKIRDLAFPGTGIAYVPHTVDLSRSIAFAKSRPNEHGTWHPEDRLFVLVKTGTGQEIGVLSLDEPLDGMAPSLATLGPLRVVERLLALGAAVLQERVLSRDLKQKEKAYRALVDGAPVGIYRRDGNGRMLSANPRLAEIFGYPSTDELVADPSFVEPLRSRGPRGDRRAPRGGARCAPWTCAHGGATARRSAAHGHATRARRRAPGHRRGRDGGAAARGAPPARAAPRGDRDAGVGRRARLQQPARGHPRLRVAPRAAPLDDRRSGPGPRHPGGGVGPRT